jgi:hypothetical protein
MTVQSNEAAPTVAGIEPVQSASAAPLPAATLVMPAATVPVASATALGPDGQPLRTLPPDNFWQHPWVQNVLPFITSLAVHAAILVIGLLAFGVYKAVSAPPPQDQVVIPESTMAAEGPPGGVPNVGLGNDPLREAAQDKDPSVTNPQWADRKGPNVDITTMAGASGDTNDAVIGLGPGGGFGKGGGAVDVGSGSGNGAAGGALAMFGAPGGGGIGPQGPVFGNGGNARLITFVCDASGSMLQKMPSLKAALSKSIHDLRPIQSFSVIFFQESAKDLFFLDPALIPATPENKRKFDQFLGKVTTTGKTDPIPGIDLAFRQRPQLVYLLTDGDFPDNKAVLGRIRELNRDRKVRINTIAFINKDDKDVDFKQLLKTIANENGGKFTEVNEEDL